MTEERERELRIRLEVLEHAIKQYNSVYILAPFIQEKKTIERILYKENCCAESTT